MKRLRMRPEIWASTMCLLGSSTRNIVPASTDLIVPSSSIASSCCFMRFFCRHPVFAGRRHYKMPWLAAGTGELARALFASTRFVDGEAAALKIRAVKGAHGGVGRDGVGHRDETEAARAAGHLVVDESHVTDLAVFFEKILEIVFSR